MFSFQNTGAELLVMKRHMANFLKGFFSVALLCTIAACMTVPVSGRHAFNIVPEGVENSLGVQSYQTTLKAERLSNDARLSTIVTRVGQRIAAVAGKPDYQWEYKLIDKNEQNAFCLPGGKIAVYTGILSVAKNEAGLATVLSHEVAHALARHGGQRISANIATVGGLVALQQTVLKENQNGPYIMAALGLGSQVGIMLPYGRAQETEADEIGQMLMARAGYDPAESVRFWGRFAAATGGQSMPALLSTHPSSASREENLRNRLPSAQTEYSRASTKYGLGESF